MKYEIDENTLKGLIDYLSTRPYKEVFQGMEALLKLKEIKEEKEDGMEKSRK